MKKSNSLAQELQEVITKHTEQDSISEELDGFPFQVIFAANSKDDVKILVQWPEDVDDKKVVHLLSHMLHHITSGNWNTPVMSAVAKHGEKKNKTSLSININAQWQGMSQLVSASSVCVSPSQVFKVG